MASLTFYDKNIEILHFQQPKYSSKDQMIEQKEFSPKKYSNISLNTSKQYVCYTHLHKLSRFLLPFCANMLNTGKLIDNWKKHSIKIKNTDKQ